MESDSPALWDAEAVDGEVCCKELADHRWLEEGEIMPICGRSASKVIVCEDGERLPFCSVHWGLEK